MTLNYRETAPNSTNAIFKAITTYHSLKYNINKLNVIKKILRCHMMHY